MPVVPYEQQVDSAGIPSARLPASVTPADYGADIAGGIGHLGQVQSAVYLEAKRQADDLAAMDAEVKASHLVNQSLYDPKSGALNVRGKDAAGIPDKLYPQLDKGFADIEGSLSNDTQRQAFTRIRAGKMQEVDGTVQRHIATEFRAFDDQTTQSMLATLQNDATTNAGDGAIVAAKAQRAREVIAAYRQRNGLPEEWETQHASETVSAMHRGAIEELLATGNDAGARARFGEVKDEVVGQDRTTLERALQASTDRDQSRSISDGVLMESKTLQGALDELERYDVKDTKVYDQAKDRIVHHFGRQQEAQAQEQRDLLGEGLKQLNAAPGKGFEAIDPSLVGRMDGQTEDTLRARAAQQARREQPVTDPTLYNELYTQSSTEATLPDFLQRDLNKEINRLSPQDFQEMVKLQAQKREAYAKKDDSLRYVNGVDTNEQVVRNTFLQLGLDPNSKSKGDADRMAAFRKQFSRAAAALQGDKKRPIEPAEAQAIADKLAGEVTWSPSQAGAPAPTVGGILFHPLATVSAWRQYSPRTTPLFESQFAAKVAYSVRDIPASDYAQIVDSLTRKGAALTPDAIMTVYNTSLDGAANGR